MEGRQAALQWRTRLRDGDSVLAALRKRSWRAAAPVGAAASLARIVSAQAAHLATQPLATLVSGQAQFLLPTEAMR